MSLQKLQTQFFKIKISRKVKTNDSDKLTRKREMIGIRTKTFNKSYSTKDGIESINIYKYGTNSKL